MDNEGNEATVKSATAQKSLKGTAVKKSVVCTQKKYTVKKLKITVFLYFISNISIGGQYCTLEKFVTKAPFSETESQKRPL